MAVELNKAFWKKSLAIVALHFALTQLGLLFALAPVGISPIWPPTGLALAVILRFGSKFLPVVFVGAAFSNLTFVPVLLSISSSAATCVEVTIAAIVISRFSSARRPFDSPRAVFFFIVATTLASLVGAVLGVIPFFYYTISDWSIFPTFLETWWLGDLFGMLVVAPFILTWRRWPRLSLTPRRFEAICLFFSLLAVGSFVFWGWGLSYERYPIEHLCLPSLIWATFRFGQKGAVTSIATLSIIAIWGTAKGYGPFAYGSAESLLLLQLFIGTSTMTALFIAASRKQHLKTQKELEHSESLYQSLVESTPLSIFRKDLFGNIVFANSRFCEMTGQPLPSILGKKDHDVFEHDCADKYVADDQRVIRTAREIETVEEIRKKGKSIFVHTIKSPVHNADGKLIGVMGAFWDVTRREETQRALHRAMKMADSANVAKSEFLANMSHEIRTPLAAILGFVERMSLPDQTEKDRLRDIRSISRSVNHLTELIDDILDLSKIEAGKLTIENQRFDLIAELSHVYRLMKAQAESKCLVLDVGFMGPVARYMTTDPRRLRQILINIIGNAIKFTKVGGVKLEVRHNIKSENYTWLTIVVTDSGCGITPEAQEHLFNPFVQADASTTRKFGGTGLGLALSRRLAQSLGGNVRLLESSTRLGSIFEISILGAPTSENTLVDRPVIEEVESPGAESQEATSPAFPGKRILVAEDGEDNQELVNFFLTSSGAKVEIACNGEEAVKKASTSDFDVILMDIQMPLMDGYTATKKIRASGYKLPIIALTAHAMLEEKARCLAAGCDDYLTKPFSRSSLISTVGKHLAQTTPVIKAQSRLANR